MALLTPFKLRCCPPQKDMSKDYKRTGATAVADLHMYQTHGADDELCAVPLHLLLLPAEGHA
jgi:hypothetical protein